MHAAAWSMSTIAPMTARKELAVVNGARVHLVGVRLHSVSASRCAGRALKRHGSRDSGQNDSRSDGDQKGRVAGSYLIAVSWLAYLRAAAVRRLSLVFGRVRVVAIRPSAVRP